MSKTPFEQGGGEIDPETLVEDDCSPPTRSRFCSNIFSIPCCSLSVWYWNGWHLGSYSGYRPRNSCLWYCQWCPPTRIHVGLLVSSCSYHQSFFGSWSSSWVKSAILDWVWHIIVLSGNQGLSTSREWTWSFLESERNWEGTRNEYDSENQGHIKETLATLYLRRTAYGRYYLLIPLWLLINLYLGFSFLSHGSQVLYIFFMQLGRN